MVIFPLRQWKKIEEILEDLEDAERFGIAYGESRGQKLIALKELKKKASLFEEFLFFLEDKCFGFLMQETEKEENVSLNWF